MMNKISTILFMAVLCICGICSADTIKGTMESVNIKTYEIVVNGKTVNVSAATVDTENDMRVSKNILIRDLKDHRGETAVCYGSINDKDNTFHAYRVKILEGHK